MGGRGIELFGHAGDPNTVFFEFGHGVQDQTRLTSQPVKLVVQKLAKQRRDYSKPLASGIGLTQSNCRSCLARLRRVRAADCILDQAKAKEAIELVVYDAGALDLAKSKCQRIISPNDVLTEVVDLHGSAILTRRELYQFIAGFPFGLRQPGKLLPGLLAGSKGPGLKNQRLSLLRVSSVSSFSMSFAIFSLTSFGIFVVAMFVSPKSHLRLFTRDYRQEERSMEKRTTYNAC